MLTAKIDHGLCMTCNNAPTCFYHNTRGPALFCEMFDDYVPPVVRIGAEKVAPVPVSSMVAQAADEEVSKYAGLCVNCRHRATCTHPRPTGGVWHCEDYD